MAYSQYYVKSGMFHGSVPLIMGTRLDALIFGTNPVQLNSIWDEVLFETERLHSMLNRFDPSSEISLLSKDAVHAPVGVNDELWEVLLDCRKYHELTSGLFDITLTGFSGIQFDMDGHTIFFDGREFTLDLGGYAKGYAMKKIRNFLNLSGVNQAFFNFGSSSVMTLGNHPSGKPWLVGIDNPFQPGQQLGTVELSGNSMSTSGNLPNHRLHVVDPATGELFRGRKVVSVVAGSDTEAEVLSTALLLADQEKAEQIKKNFQHISVYTFDLQ
ncbi:MAG TPA: FAD:protein FMN transferase [Prolixibacteraceae bacterium]|nr:FAD:protein FMN transferase [Prolixibacteraceae bacterium]